MNREILFKAITVDGKWVEGNFNKYATRGSYIKPHDDKKIFGAGYEIIPETVCQFTGLLDKNGNKIWEGDNVKFTMGDKERVCVIEYRNGWFMVESDGFFGMGEFDTTTIGIAIDEMDESEIIGNIHDHLIKS